MSNFDLFMGIPVGLKLTERQRKAIDKLDLYNRRAILKTLMAEQGIEEKEVNPNYGNATAKELDNYMKNYQSRIGKTRTGIIAPYKDFKHNKDTMEKMKLKESDPFFHCKANYEAASRGLYGTMCAAALSVGREIIDELRKGDSFSEIMKDLKADARGISGGATGKTLKETCPTHHMKYK